MQPLLIVNPRSGGGRTGQTFDRMRGPIEKALGPVDVAFTDKPRHAAELAEQAALEGRETVIAVGGDGSIHEVASGLLDARERGGTSARLGIIGQGTGGDFRKTLGLEHRLDRYLDAIAGGKTRAVDVGRFSCATTDSDELDRRAWFVNILSVGIGGLVDRYVAQTTRSMGGTAAYFVASLRGLVESAVGVVECTIREGDTTRVEEVHTRNMAICNGRYFGSGMHVAPMAELDDGLFDVVDLGGGSRLRFATLSSSIYSGTHLQRADVRHFRCDRIELRLKNRDVRERFLLDVDGEPLGMLPLVVECVPRALEVFV